MSNWVDVDINCGECYALIANFREYKTCDNYCSTIGLQCVFAAEQVQENCEIKQSYSCDFDFHTELSTSDALCECRPCN